MKVDYDKLAKEYKTRFEKMSDAKLIATFNGDVGKPGWVTRRGYFLAALRNEFKVRGFDYSAIANEWSMSLKKKVKLVGKKITII
ncbi:MAG: hypothetical protein NTV24_05355 [Candidatus Woesebacteria bacterium]|nr:hypothetical protein [Candidatus Woesebacteria bacterium]